jgi:hypothetical protein
VVKYTRERFGADPWAHGPWCWMLMHAVELRPVPCSGRQGLWVPDDGVLAAGLDQLK